MLSRSDDEFRSFQNYTRLFDYDRNNFIKTNGIDHYDNSEPLNPYMIQDPYVMNPEGTPEEYTALNINNPAEFAYGCKLPEGYNPMGVENLNENFSNKINWAQGPNPFLMQEDFNHFDYPYNSYLNNLYEPQTFERNMEEVPQQSLFENSLTFDPQLNFNNFYANEPGYYCPNPMDYPQGSLPPNALLNPRSLALAAQNPQIPPGVDPIPTSNFNQTIDNIPSSAPNPFSKYPKLSKNPSLNPSFVMPPLHGNGMNQHYRLANHPSQKYFHYANGNRIPPPNSKEMYRKAGTSALVNDAATTNPLTMSEALATDNAINNARNIAVPSTSVEVPKQLGTKTENTIVKNEKNENSSNSTNVTTATPTVTPAQISTTTTPATTTIKAETLKQDEKSKSNSLFTTSGTVSSVTNTNITTDKSESEPTKMDIDSKSVNIKIENIKKDENTSTLSSTPLLESSKNVLTKASETKIINTTVPAPVVTTVAPVDNGKAAPAAEISKPLTSQANNNAIPATTKPNSNTVTTANGVVRVRKRHQVKVACVNCRKACKKCDENRPCARCIKMDLCSTCVDGERKPREKGVRRGPYKRQKQLQQQQQQNNSPNDSKNKTTEKDGLQKTRQKRKKTQKQLKQESETENTNNKATVSNSLQVTNPTVTGTVQATVNMANPIQVQNPETQLLQTTLPQDPTLQLTQPTTDILNGTQPYNDLYGLYSNDPMYLNYFPTDMYYCAPAYSYSLSDSYVLPQEKVAPTLEECESFYKINPESATTTSPNATNTTISTVRGTPNEKLVSLSSSDVIKAINSSIDTTDI